MKTNLLAAGAAMAAVAAAQNPFRAESTSSISLTAKQDYRTVTVHNVAYQYTETRVPGRPTEERLALRITTHAEDVIGDIPQPGKVTLEAWPLGADPRQKPLYALHLDAFDAHTLDNAFWMVHKGDVDVSVWSVLKLGSGEHLFDTFVDLVRFSITKDVQTPRYVGLDVPPDNVRDPRLKDPHVVAVVTYASEDRVIRELLLTHADAAKARELRGYEDQTRTVVFVSSPTKRLRVVFTPNLGGSPAVEVTVPLKGDDLDATAARLPPGMRIVPFQRTR
jgi:hypothetical protein